MRNWNIDANDFSIRVKEFIAYLWGIETADLYISVQSPEGFIAYLWGIETEKVLDKVENAINVYRVPMRNWNYQNIRNQYYMQKSLSRTYEELKQRFKRYFK